MNIPHVTLNGLPIVLHAGAVQQQYSTEGGYTDVRLSDGSLVRMSHWTKEVITLSGQGWMGPGLNELDYTEPLELRCTAPKSNTGPSNVLTIPENVRPDVPPWGHALVGDYWKETPATASGTTAACTPVTGATQYRVSWMPWYWVLCNPPQEATDPGAGDVAWQFTAQEI